MTGYWNPLPTARRLVDGITVPAADLFQGVWEQRNRRNVPGPFYAGETDIMAMGRLDAPDHFATTAIAATGRRPNSSTGSR